MSYGRAPYYIWDGLNGFSFIGTRHGLDGYGHPDLPVVDCIVPHEAIAQLIASIAWRGTDHLQAIIDEGLKIRPELKPITVTVNKETPHTAHIRQEDTGSGSPRRE